MSKHHHQSKADQIYNKAHGVAPFHHEKMPNSRSETVQSGDIQTKVVKVDEVVPRRSSTI